MFGIEPNLDKVFGGMLKPQPQKLVDYQAYRLERDNVRYTIFGRRVENNPAKWLRGHFQVLRNSGLTVGGNHV